MGGVAGMTMSLTSMKVKTEMSRTPDTALDMWPVGVRSGVQADTQQVPKYTHAPEGLQACHFSAMEYFCASY